MLSFSQDSSGAVENPEAFDCERGAHYNGNYSIYFSSKRPIDKLKLRIITILQDQLEEAKISQTRVRVWFADEARVSDLKKRDFSSGSSSTLRRNQRRPYTLEPSLYTH